MRDTIFSLPDDTLLYPGHDYRGRTVTTVGEEKRFNPRLGLSQSENDFVATMSQLDLAYPKRIDIAVPSNLECGLALPADVQPAGDERPGTAGSVAGVMEIRGRQDAEMWMGLGI